MRSADNSTILNREALDEYSVEWHWATDSGSPGITAVMRVKDEARSLPWVLPGVLTSTEHVVLVDNGSTDGTGKVAVDVANGLGLSGKLTLLDYPFEVARCGDEHRATPPDSIRSLTYYYNWCFSHVRSNHALKWDGDMVLTHEGEQLLADLNWQLGASDLCIRGHHAAVYVHDDHTAFVDLGGVSSEYSGWPNRPRHQFTKGFDYERIQRGEGEPLDLPPGARFELKWLDEDEFSHWSDSDFSAGGSSRKRREWEVFSALGRGQKPPRGVERVESPDAHIVEHLKRVYPGMSRAQYAREK